MRRVLLMVKVVCFVLLAVLACDYCCRVLNRDDYGSTWRGYCAQPANTIEILGVGSSHMYCMLNPYRMYETDGVSAYVLAFQQQPIELTYRYLELALRRQRPKVVLLESLYAAFYDSWQYAETAVIHSSLDGLPFWQRLGMLRDLKLSNNVEEYVFPVLRYHTRWPELTESDFGPDVLPDCRGAHMQWLVESHEAADVFDDTVEEWVVFEGAKVWLRRIRELVAAHDARLVLVTAPWCMGVWKENCAKHLAFRRYADEEGYEHVDMFREFDQVGLDARNCFGDSYHLNMRGSRRATDYLSAYLRTRIAFDRRYPPDVQAELSRGAATQVRQYKEFEDKFSQQDSAR